MKRTTRLIVSTVALAATVTGVAAAASSPTVATGGATKITHFADAERDRQSERQ